MSIAWSAKYFPSLLILFPQTTHVVLSVGAADGCAVHMAKAIMTASPALKHAVLLQVFKFVASLTRTVSISVVTNC